MNLVTVATGLRYPLHYGGKRGGGYNRLRFVIPVEAWGGRGKNKAEVGDLQPLLWVKGHTITAQYRLSSCTGG